MERVRKKLLLTIILKNTNRSHNDGGNGKPDGTEKEWVEKFKKYDLIEWTQLNYIGRFSPD